MNRQILDKANSYLHVHAPRPPAHPTAPCAATSVSHRLPCYCTGPFFSSPRFFSTPVKRGFRTGTPSLHFRVHRPRADGTAPDQEVCSGILTLYAMDAPAAKACGQAFCPHDRPSGRKPGQHGPGSPSGKNHDSPEQHAPQSRPRRPDAGGDYGSPGWRSQGRRLT